MYNFSKVFLFLSVSFTSLSLISCAKDNDSHESILNGIQNPTSAFLDVIAYAEGTDKLSNNGRVGYNIAYTFASFDTNKAHEGQRRCSKTKLCSDAQGRYQFKRTTWTMANGGKNLVMIPANQDNAATWLLRHRGVTNYSSVLSAPAFANVMRKLNTEWASLPGSPYGQPTHPTPVLFDFYKKSL